MTQITVITRSGEPQTVETPANYTVMESIRDAGIDELLALCGGSCSCATCHVYVDPDFLDKIAGYGDDENDLLDGSDYRQPNSRLSCQIKISPALDGMTVTIAPEE